VIVIFSKVLTRLPFMPHKDALISSMPDRQGGIGDLSNQRPTINYSSMHALL